VDPIGYTVFLIYVP